MGVLRITRRSRCGAIFEKYPIPWRRDTDVTVENYGRELKIDGRLLSHVGGMRLYDADNTLIVTGAALPITCVRLWEMYLYIVPGMRQDGTLLQWGDWRPQVLRRYLLPWLFLSPQPGESRGMRHLVCATGSSVALVYKNTFSEELNDALHQFSIIAYLMQQKGIP